MIISNTTISPLSPKRSGVTPIDFTGISNYIYLGDSIMFGQNATAGNSFRELLTTNYATTSNNLAVGARGVWREAKESALIGYTRNQTVMWCEAGLNDLRRNSTTPTFNKIESCLKTLIRKHFAATGINAGSSSTVKTGIWTSADLTPFGGISNTITLGTASSSAINSTIGSTCSWTFSGDNVYVMFSASDNTIARGNCEVRIDGVLVETITDLNNRYDGFSDGDYDNKRGPDTRFYFGLGSGSHTIQITVTSSNPVVIDVFGTLDSPSNLGVFAAVQIPYIVDYSKAGLDQASDAIIDQANDLREGIVNEFKALGYKIGFLKIMKNKGGFYDLANVDPVDDVHPTNAGHLQIYNSLTRYIG